MTCVRDRRGFKASGREQQKEMDHLNEGIPLVDRGREAPAPATPPRKGRYDDPLEDAYDEGFDPEEAYDENPYAGSDMIDPAEDPGGPRYGTL